MGLVVTRKTGESLLLEIAPGTTPEELYRELMQGIRIRLDKASGSIASLDITTSKVLQISRQGHAIGGDDL